MLSFDGFWGSSTFDLKSSGRFWMNRHLSAAISNLGNDLNLDSHHVLFSASGLGYRELTSGGRLSLLLSLGLRNDGKGRYAADALEAFSRIKYIGHHGLNLSGSSGLVQFAGPDSQNLRLTGSLDYDQGADLVGSIAKISATLKPVNGENSDLIWSSGELVGNIGSSVNNPGLAANMLESEFGYGIEIWDKDAILTPFGGMRIEGSGSNEYRVGSRLNTGSDHSFELEAAYHEPEDRPTDIRVGLDGKVRW